MTKRNIITWRKTTWRKNWRAILLGLSLSAILLIRVTPVVAETSGTLVTRTTGGCVITVPRANEGVVSVLKNVCSDVVPRVFGQLGAVTPKRTFKPVAIRVVEHPSEMHQLAPPGTGLPLWSGAVAFPAHNLVMLPLQRLDGSAATDLETTLVHELSHVAFYRASGGAKTPRWFSEGVAILQSEGSPWRRSSSIWWASLVNNIQPLSAIENYPEGAKAAEQAYAQAADFTAFLIDRAGWGGIRHLLSGIKKGETFDEAFFQAFGVNSRYLEKKWRDQLFGGMGWLMHVTGDATWLGLGALLCIAGYFLMRRRKNRRLKEMEEEEKPLDDTIAAFDRMISSYSASPDAMDTSPPQAPSPLTMERAPKRPTKIEIDGKFHTLH